MSKTKILVCGSAGFLMSNFIRYLLYRTKEYDIVSVDWLIGNNDYKRVYKHKKHNFYLGDLRDKRFVETLIEIEKPDYIVNSVSYSMIEEGATWIDALKIFDNLIMQRKPMIQIIPSGDLDDLGAWEVLRRDEGWGGSFKEENVLLEIPNCFGIRHRCGATNPGSIAYIVSRIIEDKEIEVSEHTVPWVYAEDVGSLIWFLIENKSIGYYKIPELGFYSEYDMAVYAGKVLGIEPKIKIRKDAFIERTFKSNKLEGWKPDSKSLNEALEKTVKWYDVNRWAFKF